jgi:hypothetical protein
MKKGRIRSMRAERGGLGLEVQVQIFQYLGILKALRINLSDFD